MNPPNKHIPTLVFLFGVGCLIYSMWTFFRPQSGPAPAAPTAAINTPEKEAQKNTRPQATEPDAPPAAEPPAVSSDWLAQQNEAAQKIVQPYLKAANLEMLFPENTQAGEVSDGNYKILLGASAAGRIGLFFFTGPAPKGKFVPEKQREYLEDFFKNDLKLKVMGTKGTPYNNRNGIAMTMYKGFTGKTDEYMAYVFKNPSTAQAHIVFLTDKELSRHPAKIRVLVDSIKASR